MSRTLMPTPELPDVSLATKLPILREMLEEQRRFRLDQLAELVRHGNFGQRPVGQPAEATVDPRGEVAATLAVGATVALHNVQTALARMDAGRYGECLRCSKPISLDRLSVIPESELCARCQRRTDPSR